MHRLIKGPGSNFYKYSRESFSTLNNNGKSCLLCKINNICRGSFIYNSTVAHPSLKYKKPRKRCKKEYAELLVVSENSLCQRRANIKKLTFSDLELLASTNLNLSELYKLKEISENSVVTTVNEYTYNNLNVIENFPSSNISSSDITSSSNKIEKTVVLEVPKEIIFNTPTYMNILRDKLRNESGIEHNTELNNSKVSFFLPTNELITEVNGVEPSEEHEADLDSIKVVNTFQPEVIDEQISEVDEIKDPPDKPIVKASIDRKRRKEIITKTIAAYIEVCSSLKNPQRGLNALQFHRFQAKRMGRKQYVPIQSKNVYNVLLKGFADKGDLPKVREVLAIMQEDHIDRNIQTYVAIFECLGRDNVNNYLEEIKKFAEEAQTQGITFDMIMNKGVFLNKERELVLNAIRCFSPNYEPQYQEPQVTYNNHLVNGLNHSDQQKPFVLTSDSSKGLFTEASLMECVEKQIEMEKDGYVTINSIEKKGPVTEEIQRNRNSLEEHYKMWENEALKAFNRDLATLTAQRSAINMEPYIRSIPAKDCIAIIVEEAKKMAQGSETYSPTVNMLYKELGSKVYARYKILSKQKKGVLDKVTDIHKTYCNHYSKTHKPLNVLPVEEVTVNSRQTWQWIDHSLKRQGATLETNHQEWVPTILTFIGKFLYHIVMYDLKVDVNVLKNSKHKNYLPAFYTIFRAQGRIIKEEVKPHPILCKLYRQSHPETLTFPTNEVPMVCPPIPWISTEIGGYLISPCDVIRLPTQATSQRDKLKEVGEQQLYPSLDALNQLASVPWKVNQKVLDVILEVFNNGGSSTLDVPEPSWSLTPPPFPSADTDKSERYQLFRQRMQYRRKKAEMYSLWCDCLYRLSLANHFRDTIFWLPHNMDFRGRVYPVPPHLNHLGSDLARSMLVFAEPRPLGPHGLDWLKIHLINLTGLKKNESVNERLRYANEIIDKILDSAEKPLTGNRWWAESDEPWQTLACCMEIAKVLRSPDPEQFLSHFPIHQDGSCNGLQHYAALGRDSGGAFSVNLTPSEKPQDVYSAVVTLVEQQRAKDAANGIEIAKVLEGFIKRKVIKQTIMTTVYGVTRFGARLQIARQLKDIDEFPKESVWAASSYLTSRTFESLRTMFTSTREIQDWFTECARLISSVGSQHVEWITPLGLPIVQPYFKYRKAPSGPTYESYIMDKYEKPNVMKQKNAFPPNFIHSLDSSHMMLTSLNCERAGITFVSVHDCYWTHPSTVHIMNKICREQFVALHSEPILEDLSKFLWNKFSYDQSEFSGDGSVGDLTKMKLNRILRHLPKRGDFDINQVLKSIYFFS
ncbi:DNA-directed RNA polymerase, mitochondrial [Diorhabda sublineata]|uniref:DNA-directed RNA polymerase, mitochondrial n=1 Tax=Diorhabda sublineata TaxID=1163346 RepID=UPI0024E09DBC|nr:DNA-directed RNA polymerase, mitochondrial [Diorhabda sublineata]